MANILGLEGQRQSRGNFIGIYISRKKEEITSPCPVCLEQGQYASNTLNAQLPPTPLRMRSTDPGRRGPVALVGGPWGVTGQRVKLTTAAAQPHTPGHITLDLLLRANCCPPFLFLHVTWAISISKTLGRVPAPELTMCSGSFQTI